MQSFVQAFKKAYGVVPDGLAALGYDAMKVLGEALEKSPSLSTEEITRAIAGTSHFKGVTGMITIDQNRNTVKSAVVLKVEASGFKYVTTVHP